MHTYTPANSVFDGTVTNLLSMLYILKKSFYLLVERGGGGGGGLMISSLALLFGRFPSDGAASMAVKGLIRVVYLHQ